MSHRNWPLTWLAGLSAALLAGCASSSAWTGLDPRNHVPDLLDQRDTGHESPYHPQAGDAPPPSDVKPATHRERPVAEDPPTLPANPQPAAKPAETVPPAPREQQQESKKTLASDEPLVVALRAYLRKHPADALDALGRYSKANQDMLLVALPFAARLTEGDIDKVSPREAAELADLLQGAEDRLRQRAALRIEKLVFCRRIDDFGEYVAREPVNNIHTFEGGAGDQPGEPIQVYIELRNVSSRQHGDCYETRLAGTIELIDFERHSAYRSDFQPDPHRGHSPRHDFFVNCSFSVPRKVPPGRYTLRVEVRDITGLPADPTALRQAPPAHRVAWRTLDLQVIEPRPDRSSAATR
jgi:hypothetical protein